MLFSLALGAIITLFGPIFLAWWFVRRYQARWKWVFIGALAFIGSQVVHLPIVSFFSTLVRSGALPLGEGMVQLALSGLILGLLAGLCEGAARWISVKLLKDEIHTWKAPIALGIGHGGIESMIFVGLGIAATVIIYILLQQNPAVYGPTLDPSGQIQASMGNILSEPWYMGLAGAVERIFTVIFQVTLTTLVWFSVTRHKAWVFWAAVGYHAFSDGFIAVFLNGLGVNVWILEGLFGLLAVFNVWLLVRLFRGGEPAAPVEPALTQ